jgi:hypothetical protein
LKGALEAESLRVARKTGGVTESQADSRWSGGEQLWWRDGKPGDVLELVVPVSKGGACSLSIHVTRAFDYGTIQFSMDGKKLGGPVDLYSAENVVDLVRLGRVQLEPGEHRFAAEITGSNPAAKARHMLGLDCLILEPAAR